MILLPLLRFSFFTKHYFSVNLLRRGEVALWPLGLRRFPKTMSENPTVINAKTRYAYHTFSAFRTIHAPSLKCPERRSLSLEHLIVVHLLFSAISQMQKTIQQMLTISFG